MHEEIISALENLAIRDTTLCTLTHATNMERRYVDMMSLH